jgi:phosphate transport system protein
MTQDLRRSFHTRLDGIKEGITRLAAGVIETIPRATQILLDADLEGAEYVILADDAVNERAAQLEESCYQLLALQSPMASDLRAIVAAVKIIGDIERSADLVVNLCKATRRMYPCRLDPKLRGLVARMGEQAQQLFKYALDAYVEGDAPLASAIGDMDDLLDRLQVQFVAQIFESHQSESIPLQVAVQLALVARFYERIGDHAVNIADRVRYMVTGDLADNDREDRMRRAATGNGTNEPAGPTTTAATAPERGAAPATAGSAEPLEAGPAAADPGATG